MSPWANRTDPAPQASLVIRTLNEEKGLGLCLKALQIQKERDIEVLVVDSGSTDGTCELAKSQGAEILSISPEKFTYGRALNLGISRARGRFVVTLSAHAVPADAEWLGSLLRPLRQIPRVGASFCRQLPMPDAFPFVRRLTEAAYPDQQENPVVLFSNAGAAFHRDLWERTPFDENLPGSEDLAWAQEILKSGFEIRYCPESRLYHSHNESFARVRRRYLNEERAKLGILGKDYASWPYCRAHLSGFAKGVVLEGLHAREDGVSGLVHALTHRSAVLCAGLEVFARSRLPGVARR